MGKRIFAVYLLAGMSLFSNRNNQNSVIRIIEKNKVFTCRTLKKAIRVEGENFIGHFDETGKPYGEWSLKDGSIRQCFLEDEEVTDYKGVYFLKKNKDIILRINYSDNANEIFIKENGKFKGYYFNVYDGKYFLKKDRRLGLNEIRPLYERLVIR